MSGVASGAANAAGADVPSVEEHELKPSDISSKLEKAEKKDKNLLMVQSQEASNSKKEMSSESSEGETMKASNEESKSGDSSSDKSSNIKYISVGSKKEFKKYDKFFRKSAELKGLTVLTRKFIQSTEKAVEGGFVDSIKDGSLFTKALGEGTDISPKARRKIVELTMSGKFGGIPKKVKEISKKNFKSFQKTLFKEYPNLETTVMVGPVVVKKLKPKRISKRAMKMVKLGERLGKEAPEKFKGPEASLVPRLTKEASQTVKQLKQVGEDAPKLADDMKSLAESSMKKLEGGDKSASM